MTVGAGLDVAVVHEDVERVRDTFRCIAYHVRIEPLEGTPRTGGEHVPGCCFREDLHGDGIALVFQALLEAGLVVDQVVLPGRPEERVAIHVGDVADGHSVTPLRRGGVPQPREEGLNVVRNADTERLVHRLGDTVLDAQFMALREAAEAFDAGVPGPWTQTKGIQMVDAVGNAEPAHERLEPDAAGHEENGSVASERLQNATQPTQEFVGPTGMTVVVEHALDEDRQLVDDEENRLFLCAADAKQRLAVVPPASGIEPGPDLHTEVDCADFVDVLAHPTLHVQGQARRDWANGMHGPRDVGDRVLGAGRSLDIDKKEYPAVRFEPAPQFAEDAGLPHAPLPGQQHMIPVPNARFEYSQIGFAVEEVVTAYPAAGGRSHGSSHSTNLMNRVSPTQSVVNNPVDNRLGVINGVWSIWRRVQRLSA